MPQTVQRSRVRIDYASSRLHGALAPADRSGSARRVGLPRSLTREHAFAEVRRHAAIRPSVPPTAAAEEDAVRVLICTVRVSKRAQSVLVLLWRVVLWWLVCCCARVRIQTRRAMANTRANTLSSLCISALIHAPLPVLAS